MVIIGHIIIGIVLTPIVVVGITNKTGTRGQGLEGSSERLKNYKDLKVWQETKEERHLRNLQNVKDTDKVFNIQSLEPLTP